MRDERGGGLWPEERFWPLSINCHPSSPTLEAEPRLVPGCHAKPRATNPLSELTDAYHLTAPHASVTFPSPPSHKSRALHPPYLLSHIKDDHQYVFTCTPSGSGLQLNVNLRPSVIGGHQGDGSAAAIRYQGVITPHTRAIEQVVANVTDRAHKEALPIPSTDRHST